MSRWQNSPEKVTPGIGETAQNYTKAIYALQQKNDGVPVTTNALAERLGVTPASSSAMVKKLAELDLVEHEPYRGVSLTEKGKRIAVETLRHHRLLELYLAQELGMSWDKVHDEAEVLEHVISEELEELIAAKLGHPTHDPHGDPIPTRSLQIDEGKTESLAQLSAGERGTLVRVSDSDPEMLRYLSQQGIAIGSQVEVLTRQQFGDSMVVNVDGKEHLIGGKAAAAMRVELR